MVAKRSGGFNCDKETNDDLSKLWDLPTPAGQFCEKLYSDNAIGTYNVNHVHGADT